MAEIQELGATVNSVHMYTQYSYTHIGAFGTHGNHMTLQLYTIIVKRTIGIISCS